MGPGKPLNEYLADSDFMGRRLDNQNTLTSSSDSDQLDAMQEENEVDELKVWYSHIMKDFSTPYLNISLLDLFHFSHTFSAISIYKRSPKDKLRGQLALRRLELTQKLVHQQGRSKIE